MEAIFWTSAVLIAYVYGGYPALLGAWAWVVSAFRPGDPPSDRAVWPGVSVVIAARNEAPRLPARIENLLASDYPKDRLQIIVASDGSTDATVEALAPYARCIELIMLPPGGKALALNAAVSRAVHPILVFADARQQFAPDAIRRLVRHFARLSVGAVSGELVLDIEARREPSAATGPDDRPAVATSTIGDGLGLYWRYEKWLRRREAIVGSTLGVTGAIYAMRRALWQPLPPDAILDDVLGPMRLVLRRYRVIFDETALAFDQAAAHAGAELRRKVRTLAGNFQLLTLEPRLLVPFVNPVWLQFVSHKVGRLLVPYALIALFAASAWLAGRSAFYLAALTAQVGFYGLAAYGALLDRRERGGRAPAGEVMREAA